MRKFSFGAEPVGLCAPEKYPDLTLIFAAYPFRLSREFLRCAVEPKTQRYGHDCTAFLSIRFIYGEFPSVGLPNTMALIVSIELNNGAFEDLANLVSTACAAGADESTTIENDEEQP